MTTLGTITLWLAFLLSLWGIVVGVLGLRSDRAALVESARRAGVALSALLALAVVSLLVALARRDFNVAYVADHTSRSLSAPYLVAALNAGWEGKLLFGSFLLGLAASFRSASRAGQLAGALGLLAVSGGALLAANPFRRLPITPLDGRGLDPSLLNAGFVAGPTLVVLGYAALATGFTRLAGRVTAGRGTRVPAASIARWTLAGWVLITAGAAVDLWWVYGYSSSSGPWKWDPAATGALPVWLVVTAGLAGAWALGRRRAIGKLDPGPGARVASAGLLLVALAGLGVGLGVEREVELKPGQTASLRGRFGAVYRVTHMGVSRFETADQFVTAATLDAHRGEKPVGLVTSERRQYFDAFGGPVRDPVTRAGVRRGLLEDLRVVLLSGAADTEEAVYRVRVNPLMWCAWLGAGMLVAGGLLALLTTRK